MAALIVTVELGCSGSEHRGRLGPGRYLAFYLACGFRGFDHARLFNPTSIIPSLALWRDRRPSRLLHALVPMASGGYRGVPILFIPLFFRSLSTLFVFGRPWFTYSVYIPSLNYPPFSMPIPSS